MTSTSFRRMLWHTPMRDLVRGRITGRLDIDRLLDEASLSGSAADKVRRVVKYTRLWRLEKVDVASELIAHFTDGLEADVPVDELVETFGDERQTAKLIRRAKKRQRPIPWHVFTWARLCFLITFGVYMASILYLLTGSPKIKTDYLALINQQASRVPTDAAAWPLYRQAMLEMNLWEERVWDTPIPYYSELPEEEQEGYWEELEPPFHHSRMSRLWSSLHPNDPGWIETEQFLLEHVHTLALLREASSKPGLGLPVGFIEDYSSEDFAAMNLEPAPYGVPERSLMYMERPHLWRLSNLSLLLRADAARAMNMGNSGLAYSNIRAMLAMARQADEQPTTLNGRVRIQIQTCAYLTIQDAISEHPELWSDQQLRSIAHSIASAEIDPERWFIGERAVFYDALQRVYTDDGQGGGRITLRGASGISRYMPEDVRALIDQDVLVTAGMPAATFMIASRDEMKRVYDEILDEATTHIDQPLWSIDPATTFKARYDELMSIPSKHIRYGIIYSLMPSPSWLYGISQSAEGHRQGMMIGIALEVYRREHGDWPISLDKLTPTYLPQAALDPYTGQPMRYTVTDHGPLVYSVGVDGDDDGGRVPPDNDNGVGGNSFAGPEHFDSSDRHTHPAFDGDWVLWPVPD